MHGKYYSIVPESFCRVSAYTDISEVPDVAFIGSGSTVTEQEGLVTICAVAGQLNRSVTVIFSTLPNSANGTTSQRQKCSST